MDFRSKALVGDGKEPHGSVINQDGEQLDLPILYFMREKTIKKAENNQITLLHDDIETVDINELFAVEPDEELCLLCVHAPCLCDLVKLELKIEMLRDSKEAVNIN